MAYTPNVWKARTGTGLNRFIDQNEAIYDFVPAPLSVIEQGTPFSAEWMNHIETGVKEAHDAIAGIDLSGKQDKIMASGILKGDGAGDVSAAVAGTDYATPAVDHTASLSTTWTGSTAPYTQNVTVTGLSATAKIFVGLADTATDAEFAAAAKAQLMCTAKAAGQVTITARGTKPAIALPIIIRVVG